MLRVTSLERALPFYRLFFGTEASREAGRVWFRIVGTRLGLEEARDGESPAIAHYGVAVDPFDRAAAEARLTALGATLVPSDQPGALRFADPDGIRVEVIGTS
jgi:catechol 2,3-dioxygenase-like lactoylglutathione lyase family enzyme